jgi:hypothetical protein
MQLYNADEQNVEFEFVSGSITQFGGTIKITSIDTAKYIGSAFLY